MRTNYEGRNPIFQKWDEAMFVLDTLGMSWGGRCLYRAMLQAAFYFPSRPDLPNDHEAIQRRLQVPPEFWDAHKAEALAMFQVDPETGTLFQNRLRRDWQALCIYRDQQSERGKKSGRARQAHQTKANGTTVQPALNQPSTRREEKLEKSENIDDAHPLPSATGGTLMAETPAPPPAPTGKEDLASEVSQLVSYIYEETGCVPPDTAAVEELLGRFSLSELRSAFREFIKGKPPAKMVGAIRVFFKEPNATSIIEKIRRDEWLGNVEMYTTMIDGAVAEGFADFAAKPIPPGIPYAQSLLAAATKAIDKWKSKNGVTQ